MKEVLVKRVLWVGLLALLAAVPSYAKTATKAAGRATAQTRVRGASGPDSWLKTKVYTAQQFMEEYDQDPVLRQRLAKHFHMPEAELTQYLRTELREVTYQESHWTGTFGVKDRTGEIYPVRTYVRKGTKALGLADGTALFKLPCGNPLDRPIEPPVRPRQASKPIEPLPSIPPVGILAIEPTALQSPEEYLLGQEIPNAPVFQVPVTTEGRRFFFFWPPGGGGGGQETPEPASLLLLGAGAALLGGLARRRR